MGDAPRLSDQQRRALDRLSALPLMASFYLAGGAALGVHLGALLYVGDGHALQGDGELTGSALETSLDIELRTEVVRETALAGPRLENAEYLMAMGLDGSLDGAIRLATTDLARWLTDDYALSATDVALLLGAAVEGASRARPRPDAVVFSPRHAGAMRRLEAASRRPRGVTVFAPNQRIVSSSKCGTPPSMSTTWIAMTRNTTAYCRDATSRSGEFDGAFDNIDGAIDEFDVASARSDVAHA